MLTLVAVVALFAYVWRVKKDLDAALDQLSSRVERLEAEQPIRNRAAVETERKVTPPAVVQPPPVPESVNLPEQRTVVLPPPDEPAYVPAEVPVASAGSLETEIGSRWLLYVGIAALIVGAGYFQRLAIENEWIGERARVIEGIIAGLGLVWSGRWFVGRGYGVYGQIVAGGGVAVLYVSIYAASTLYALIGRPIAFVSLSLITVLAAWLADRYRSQGLAVVAVGGGFVAPFLLPSDRDAQVVLFTYDAVLIAGTMFLAHRRVWPLLNVLSYVLTGLTVLAWAMVFYRSSKYLITEAYLTLFCAMFLYILFRVRRSKAADAVIAQAVLWSTPVVYYIASLAILGPHSIPLLIFLGVLAAVGAGLAPYGRAAIRVAVWLAVAVPLLAWVQARAGTTWMWPGFIAVAGIYLVNLLAQLFSMSDEEPFGAGGSLPGPPARLQEPDVALLHMNPLALFAAAYGLLAAVFPDSTSMLALLFAVWNAGIAVWLSRSRRGYALHFTAVAATLAAVAIGLEFEGAARTIGWSAEGAAVTWLGFRERRAWLQISGLAVFAIAVMQFLLLLPRVVPPTYIAGLNSRTACGVIVIALAYVLAWLHRGATVAGLSAATPFVILANLLTVALLTSEITAYWHVRSLEDLEAAGRLARELMLSLTWGLYATALIVIGLRRDYAPIRYLGMTLFALTIAKVFFFDLAALEQVYRVSSVIGLGLLLLMTSYLYNRMRAASS